MNWESARGTNRNWDRIMRETDSDRGGLKELSDSNRVVKKPQEWPQVGQLNSWCLQNKIIGNMTQLQIPIHKRIHSTQTDERNLYNTKHHVQRQASCLQKSYGTSRGRSGSWSIDFNNKRKQFRAPLQIKKSYIHRPASYVQKQIAHIKVLGRLVKHKDDQRIAIPVSRR